MLKLVFARAVCIMFRPEISESCLFNGQFLPSEHRLKGGAGREEFFFFLQVFTVK